MRTLYGAAFPRAHVRRRCQRPLKTNAATDPRQGRGGRAARHASTLGASTERSSLVLPFLFTVAGLLSFRQPFYFVCCASLGYLPVGLFQAILIALGTLCVFFLSHRLERRRTNPSGS